MKEVTILVIVEFEKSLKLSKAITVAGKVLDGMLDGISSDMGTGLPEQVNTVRASIVNLDEEELKRR